jgi:uncharacterized protein YndB with AHSA1/START domain
MRVTASIEIAASPQHVWDLVSDPTSDVAWCPKVRSVDPVGPRKWRVAHAPVPMRGPVILMLEQLELEPPVRLVMREEDEASVFEVEYHLAPTGAGTRFTQTSVLHFKRIPRLLGRLLAYGVRRDVRRQLQCLRDYVDGRP